MSTPGRHPSVPALGIAATALLLLGAACVLPGCSRRDSTVPGSLERSSVASRTLGPRLWGGGASGLDGMAGQSWWRYPLAIGDRWDYLVRTRSVIVSDPGPQPATLSERPLVTEVTGTQRVGNHDYFVLNDTSTFPGGIAEATTYTRQDPGGLYQLMPFIFASGAAHAGAAIESPMTHQLLEGVDRALARSPQRAAFQRAALALAGRVEAIRHPTSGAAAGPEPGEMVVLSYPLRVGASWDVLPMGPLSPSEMVRTVEARELSRVPAGRCVAWHVRQQAGRSLFTYRLDTWYASVGLVKSTLHAELDVLDDTGNPIGRMIVDEDQSLTSVRVLDLGGSRALAIPGAASAADR